MDRLPFSVYDFFGYLSAGFLVLVGLATAFVGEAPLNYSPNLIVGLFLVVLAYAVGQVVANVSGFLLEGALVAGLIKRPTPHLFGEANRGWRKGLFPGYCRALPDSTQERVRARAAQLGVEGAAGWALFMHCHAHVKKEPITQERLDTYLNLYGFCRNCSMALLIVAPALLVGSLTGSAQTGLVSPGWWASAALLGVVGLFYRYLKFFRHYAVEVFASYAEGEG